MESGFEPCADRCMLSRRGPVLGLSVLIALTVISCDKVPLFAPTSSTITLNASARILPVGGSTQLTAVVLEGAGTVVQNGTTVRFSASLGRVEPVETQTQNGVATAMFFADSNSGTAEVRASSGAIGAGSTSGTTTPPATTPAATSSNVVQITIGGAAATAVLVSASPSTVPSTGGTVAIVASVVDGSGNVLTGIPVSFSTTAGTLSASSAISDARGEARVQLTTNRAATVTARAGATATATAAITVNAPSTVALAVAPTNPVVLQPITLTVTPTIPAGSQAPQVTVTWGDGTNDNLGTVAAARGVTHTYKDPGSFTITATAVAEGETFTTSTAVFVTFSPPVSLSVDPASGPQTTLFAFAITPTQGALIRDVTINFGDGATPTSLGAIATRTVVTHQYRNVPLGSNVFNVTVVQTLVDGTSSTASVAVTVTNP
jgi:hypothetical protein